ncbi:MAG: hypothetical protein K2X87_11465, partial [Gemmataceae bacterium]|nr:hypothetical protein [Gemmataceae bacterium]
VEVAAEPARPRPDPGPAPAADPDYLPFVELVAQYQSLSGVAELRLGPFAGNFPRDSFGPYLKQQDALRHWDRICQKMFTAENLQDLSRLAQIVPLAEKFAAEFPANPHVRYLLGTLLARRGQYTPAIQAFEGASGLGYGPEAARGAAVCAFKLGDPVRAAWRLIRFLAKRPADDDPGPFFVFLRVVDEARAYQAWDELLAAVTDADPPPPAAALLLNGLAYCLRRNDLTAEAVAAYRLAAQDPPPAGPDLVRAARPLVDRLLPLGSSAWPDLQARLSEEERRRQQAEEAAAWEERRREQERQAGTRPNGEIHFYHRSRQFGKIRDEDGVERFFHLNSVADPDLRTQLEAGAVPPPIPVAFAPGRGRDDLPTALTVRPARTVEQAVARAEALAREGRYYEAIAMVERLKVGGRLAPEHDALVAGWREANRAKTAAPAARPKAGSVYDRAKAAHRDKDFAEAERLYREAIGKRVRYESAVKDLATLLQQARRPDAAIQVLKEHDPERFDDPIAALNVLSTLYEHSNRNREAIPVLRLIRAQSRRPTTPGSTSGWP